VAKVIKLKAKTKLINEKKKSGRRLKEKTVLNLTQVESLKRVRQKSQNV